LFAQQLDARTEIRGRTTGWTAQLEGSGSLTAFLNSGVFAVGAFGLDGSSDYSLEADLTAGVGTGRFRDVTPMAKAILIQNTLLDLGELLAPISDDALLDLAQILGEVGPTDDERLVLIANRLKQTDLTRAADLGVRALLGIDRIIGESSTWRLCGSDIQARIGASAMLLPELRVSATGVVQARYAVVPDPVSQIEAHAEIKVRLMDLGQMDLVSSLSYDREIPGGWAAHAEYRLEVDRMWTDSEATVVAHAVSSSLTTEILGSVGLSLVANAEHRTGDEEITFSIGLHLKADIL
jgi:hypothetical protein